MTMRETRSSIILLRIARNLRNKTGDARYIAPVEIHGRKLWNLVYVACTRPLCEYTPSNLVDRSELSLSY